VKSYSNISNNKHLPITSKNEVIFSPCVDTKVSTVNELHNQVQVCLQLVSYMEKQVKLFKKQLLRGNLQ
jgi:hypothetical protein